MMSTTTASKAHIGKRATFTRAVAYNWLAWRAFLEAIMTCNLQAVINCSIMFYLLLLYSQFVVMINASEISQGWKPLCIDNHLELSAPPPKSASQLVLLQLRGERVLSIPCPHSHSSVYTEHTNPFWCREKLASQLKPFEWATATMSCHVQCCSKPAVSTAILPSLVPIWGFPGFNLENLVWIQISMSVSHLQVSYLSTSNQFVFSCSRDNRCRHTGKAL